MTVTTRPGYRTAAFAVALCALGAYAFQLYVTLGRYPERTLPDELWRQARYFTYLTTLLIAAAFLRIAQTGRVTPGLAAGLALWSLTVTVVYHLFLARGLDGLRWWADHGLHSLVPAAVCLWWVVYAPKAGLAPRHARQWIIWPGIYAGYALVRGEVDGRHPYFFIDPPLTGWPNVVVWSAGLAAGLWLAGLGMVALARRLNSAPGRPESAARSGPRPR